MRDNLSYEASRIDPDADEPCERLLGALIVLSAFAAVVFVLLWAFLGMVL